MHSINRDLVRPPFYLQSTIPLTLLHSYRFRPSTNFHYLTGLSEPDSTLLLISSPSSPLGYTSTLFLPPLHPSEPLWSGARPGPPGAVATFGVDEAYGSDELGRRLEALRGEGKWLVELPPLASESPSAAPYAPRVSARRGRLSKLFGVAAAGDGEPKPTKFAGGDVPPHIVLHEMLTTGKASALGEVVERLRVVKSARELAVMKRACDLSAAAHTDVRPLSRNSSAAGVGADCGFCFWGSR